VHLAISIIVIYSVWRWGDWRNWQKYHTTMLYFALGNMTYQFLTANYFLWRLGADPITNYTATEMLYTFIVFPGTALLFLSGFPNSLRLGIRRIVIWIGIYIGFEFVLMKMGLMEYQFGWNLLWSALFNCTMFPMLLLFHRKPLIAYVISIGMALFWICLFDVPVHLPIEQRTIFGP
jgi:hypothetical protein